MFLCVVVISGRINTQVNRTLSYDLSNFQQCYFQHEPGCRVFAVFLSLTPLSNSREFDPLISLSSTQSPFYVKNVNTTA